MSYILKYKKGSPLQSGRKTRGGCLRTAGGRVPVFDTKKTALDVKRRVINRRWKSPVKRAKANKAIYVKKV